MTFKVEQNSNAGSGEKAKGSGSSAHIKSASASYKKCRRSNHTKRGLEVTHIQPNILSLQVPAGFELKYCARIMIMIIRKMSLDEEKNLI